MTALPAWEFWIDVGGTFTDCLGRAPDGTLRTHKLLSSGVYRGKLGPDSNRSRIRDPHRASDPHRFFEGYRLRLAHAPNADHDSHPVEAIVRQFDAEQGVLYLDEPLPFDPMEGQDYELFSGEEAPVVGIRWLLRKTLAESIGPAHVRLGTTRGTNALLERQGAATALITTRGFRDVLRIAWQNRPRLFDLYIKRPTDLYRAVVEIDERIDAQGQILRSPDADAIRRDLSRLKEQGIESLAICLLNSYQNRLHEETVRKIGEEMEFSQISVSSHLAPMQRIVPRGDTTVVDAYLTPIIRAYVAGIRAKLPEASLKLMTSSGGLIDAERFVGKDSILSGPAGGVVGVAQVAAEAGFPRAIGFDMGGTSTDVSRYDGEFERRYSMEVNDPESQTGIRIVAPMLAIETVAAGGGSICDFDGQKLVVGPRSAGSTPGPACYGGGGPLTVTDVNLFLGRVLPDHFAFPLDKEIVRSRLEEISAKIAKAGGKRLSLDQLASGFVTIANAKMAAAIKKISIARGYDARDYVLVGFGGAGAQHTCAIARELGIKRILQHPHAGILSAFGIGMADVKRFAERHVGSLLGDDLLRTLEPVFLELGEQLRSEVLAEGIPAERILPPRRFLDLRYRGQDSTITIAEPRPGDSSGRSARNPIPDYRADFEQRHRRLYGFHFPERPVEILALRVEVAGVTSKPNRDRAECKPRVPVATHSTHAFFDDGWRDTAVHERANLKPGDRIPGPAILLEPISTIVLEPGWEAEVTAIGDILLTDVGAAARSLDLGAEVDPVILELFNNQFASIAEQMGATLQKTSLSTNVKERLDFSCALFTREGSLVVNAPHIPVHLGAMGETVRRLIADVDVMHPGDVFVTNDPYRGGSHLPDVTVVTPVFDRTGREILFFTGSRAHHAEIGGIVPGSMPPFSQSLAEEGVLIRAFRLVHGERSSEDSLRRLLSGGPYPSRSVEENVADINAAVAANQTGAQRLNDLVARYGLDTIRAYMGHIQRAAERKMRAALLKFPEGRYSFRDRLDTGAVIAATITIRHGSLEGIPGGEAIVDFTGTGPVTPDNLNANSAITRAAVLYCFRCLIDEDIPLNDGVLAPVTIHLPENCLLNPPAHDDPSKCAAVGGGNVETSQRIVDVVFGALGIVAASQGTMNNFLFGRTSTEASPGFGYYETIGGGAGAGPGFRGASAVHTHMTNTRITDAEVMEARYPVRVREFSIRGESGGSGRFPGGNGIVREIEFLAPVDISLITNRRRTDPYGAAGGGPGARGRNLLLPGGSGEFVELGSSEQRSLAAGDVLRIETPGGGGFGTIDPAVE